MRNALLLGCLLAVSPAIADDTMLASTSSDGLMIYKLKATGIDKLHVDKTLHVRGAGWTDAQTLWVLHSGGDNAVWVNKMVDGKVAEKIVIPPETWKLKGDATVSPKLKI